MDQTLQDLKGVACFFDDVIVEDSTPSQLLQRLRMVFERLLEKGLQLNRTKFQFFKKPITYLGHVIDSNGRHPMKEEIEAIVTSKGPKNVSELFLESGTIITSSFQICLGNYILHTNFFGKMLNFNGLLNARRPLSN
ncbi:hypothetical protein JTB14_035616 [Gonioctena quinquepunctata]|nr:hypothetical protein JTB14_035616 [Gonioctena quinquepunctata]